MPPSPDGRTVRARPGRLQRPSGRGSRAASAPFIPVTNPLERINGEIKRRADVIGIFPNTDSIQRRIGAVLLEANDEWATQHRYMQVEAMAELLGPPLIKSQAAPADVTEITPKAA